MVECEKCGGGAKLGAPCVCKTSKLETVNLRAQTIQVSTTLIALQIEVIAYNVVLCVIGEVADKSTSELRIADAKTKIAETLDSLMRLR